jgi:hemerythrin
MPTTFTIPTLFGRATTVLGQHATLHVLLDRLRDACANVAGASDEPGADRRRLMEEFRERLCVHFAAEEDEGYFGMVAAVSPALSTEVTHLLEEHAEFLAVVERLLALAEAIEDREEFTETLRAFLQRFNAHERAENRLMQEFFLRDEGTPGE